METQVLFFYPAPIISDDGIDIIQPWDVEHLVHAAWELTRCALWPNSSFDEHEIEATKDYLRDYFLGATDPFAAFTPLCQRVILAQRYDRARPFCYALTPLQWFGSQASFGFVATMAWLQRVEKQRRLTPGYLAHIKALADCFFRFAMEPSSERFKQGCAELIRHRASSLLVLFTASTAYKYTQND